MTLGILDGDGRGVDLRDCGLYEPGLHELSPRLADLVDDLGLEPYDVPSRRGELKHLIVTHSPVGAVMLRFVLRSQKHLALLRSRLAVIRERVPEAVVVSVNLQPDHKAVLEGDTEIVLTDASRAAHASQRDHAQPPPQQLLPDQHRGRRWALSPGAAMDFAACARPECSTSTAAWADSRSTPPCSTRVRPAEVIGIEVSAEAVRQRRAHGRRSARRASWRRSELDFRAGDATDVAALDVAGVAPTPETLVVVNPPRRGLGPELTAWLESSSAWPSSTRAATSTAWRADLAALPSLRGLRRPAVRHVPADRPSRGHGAAAATRLRTSFLRGDSGR